MKIKETKVALPQITVYLLEFLSPCGIISSYYD